MKFIVPRQSTINVIIVAMIIFIILEISRRDWKTTYSAKTASKLHHDIELFNKKLGEGDCAAKYELNKILVDFNRIPEHFVKEFNTGDYTVNYKRV